MRIGNSVLTIQVAGTRRRRRRGGALNDRGIRAHVSGDRSRIFTTIGTSVADNDLLDGLGFLR